MEGIGKVSPSGDGLEREDLQQVLARLAVVDGYGAELWPPGGTGRTPSA
jgi:hypothetical protein